ncbi:MAG: YbjN domain-containing protein [Henriciella sp.]|nr:YbjN domain-containing protein [Henriciella sp.]
MKHWILGLTTVALANFANAQEEAAQPDRDGWLMTSVSFSDLEYIVETDNYEAGQAFEDDVAIMAVSPGGTPFFMQGTACSAEKVCQGLHIWMSFVGELSDARANQLNYDYAAVSVIALNNGSYQVSRYLILDHGTTMANIKANLLNVLAIGQEIWMDQLEIGVGAAVGDLRQNEGPKESETQASSPSAAPLEDSTDSSELEAGESVMRLE